MTLTTLLFAALLATPATGRPVPAVQQWAARVVADPSSPAWKLRCAQAALAGTCSTATGRWTWYSPDDTLDPGTGGGEWGCTWTDPCGRRYAPRKLQWGQVAADLREHPTGTVLYAPPPFDRSWVVADCGPAIRGRGRIDVALLTREHLRQYGAAADGRKTVWVLGRITREEMGR